MSLFQIFIYLLAAVVAVPLAKRLGLGSVLGSLLASLLVSIAPPPEPEDGAPQQERFSHVG